MTKYDKELDTRTEEYEEAIEPLERATERDSDEPDEKADDGGAQ
ncbi:MAG: hypothetical protein QOJ98_295 [Acidobacteriota bacterium]|jgi:hypothetical protein|nr:hypothetical protein [Acidobacteriota bacterium]